MLFRSGGRVVVALVAAAFVATPVGAQESRPFKDSWFWGAKVGTLSLGTRAAPRTWAPSIGADWMITRTSGGLWVFGDYTSFDIRASVDDPSTTSGRRTVDARDLRRVGFAAVVFPRAFGRFRPYAGLGAALNVLGRATAVPDSGGGTVDATVHESVEDQRSRASIIGLLGAQAQVGRVALFTQMTAMPSNRRFLLDESVLTGLEFGVRYNFGTSIDR